MRLLLDTCTFLWMAARPEALSRAATDALCAAGNDVVLSAASAWEIAVKHALGRLDLPSPPEEWVPDRRERLGVGSLALTEAAVVQAGHLPDLHRDPFDRLLVCQALAHGMTLVTPDRVLARYPAPVLW